MRVGILKRTYVISSFNLFTSQWEHFISLLHNDVKAKNIYIVPMTRNDPFFKLRLPEDLRNRLEKHAKQNHRSLTAEILARVDETFSDTNERLEKLEKAVFDGKMGNENLLKGVNSLLDIIDTLQELVKANTEWRETTGKYLDDTVTDIECAFPKRGRDYD